MKLEEQVISLEIAKQLKTLGVKQESMWHWCEVKGGNPPRNGVKLFMGCPLKGWKDLLYDCTVTESYSAFTVAELGELLPRYVEVKDGHSFEPKDFCSYRTMWASDYRPYRDDKWVCTTYPDYKYAWQRQFALKESDSRGKMLVYLLENKLIERAYEA